MKQPVNWYQLLATAVVIIMACFAGVISSNRETAELKTEVVNLKADIVDIKIDSRQSIGELKGKIDEMQRDITQILINQEKKADRK